MVRREIYWITITDSEEVVEQELSYDAWGNRRDPETWQRFWYNPVYEEPMFDRGFTGHEHLYAFGLINMNGRVYDPLMSSFLSVDAFVQSPDNSQSFNRYSYCLNNPLKYTDPSGWLMSLPNGHGVTPPPDGDETGYYITGVYTDTGFNSEFNCYSYSYGLNEVTVTPNGNSWAREECKTLVWDNNGGGLSAEYSGGVVNVPTLGAGGGGGGFWTGGNNTSAKSEGLSSSILSFPTAAVGTLLGATYYSYKQENRTALTELGKGLSKAQKAKLAAKFPKELSKGASAAKYGEAVTKVIKKSGTKLGLIGLGISAIDPIIHNEIKPSNIYEVTTSATCLALSLCFASNPVGWIAGAVFLGAEVCSYAFTGQTIGAHLDQNISWRHNIY